jgi:hypothetical protein
VADGGTTRGPEPAAEPAHRRLPDPFALIVGLVSLGVAGTAFVGRTPELVDFDPRWLLAGAAVVLGLLLLLGSLRNRS